MPRIVYLTAGAATRFCGSCLHDNTLTRALSKLGEDILLVPTYTPLRTDEEDASLPRVFFGGINVFLQQRWALFRHTPWFVDRLFDSPRLLNWLARRSAGMEPAKLGPLTVSTLQGEHGRQHKEIEKIVYWLEHEARPEVIHISNALLLGIAPTLRKRLRVPIVCSLSGEDLFLEQLTEPHYGQARALLREQAQGVDVFVAYNHYFADFMADYLDVPRNRIEVIYHGVDLNGYASEPRPKLAADSKEPLTIGYFSRVAPEKGLHLLVEAFGILRGQEGLPPMKLRVAGYKSFGDEPYFAGVMQQVEKLGLGEAFEYIGEVDRAGKIAFLTSLDVMSVPTVYRESKGLSALEALANGVPIVVPRHGVFPELIELSGGGLLCEPNNAADLATVLHTLCINRAQLVDHARRGWQAVRSHFTAEQMAIAHRNLYRRAVSVAKG